MAVCEFRIRMTSYIFEFGPKLYVLKLNQLFNLIVNQVFNPIANCIDFVNPVVTVEELNKS